MEIRKENKIRLGFGLIRLIIVLGLLLGFLFTFQLLSLIFITYHPTLNSKFTLKSQLFFFVIR